MSEVELCKPVIVWLQDYGWDVYQEVQLRTYGPVCDIVAVRRAPPLIWGIEAKAAFSLQLLEKIPAWAGTFNYTSIAYPRVPQRKGPEDRYYRLMQLVRHHWGVGMIEVELGRSIVKPVPSRCLEQWPPRLHRVPSHRTKSVFAVIDENHKHFAAAGTADGKRWTPFQSTCKQMRTYVEAHGPVLLSDLVTAIEHHYKTPKSARDSVKHWIKAGKIPPLKIVRRHGATLVEIQPEKEDKCLDVF